MSIEFHNPESIDDLDRISEFLIKHYRYENRDGNWFYAIWEYSYTHPGFTKGDEKLVGIWEDDGEIVGATIIETERNDIALCVHPEYRYLRGEMIAYAEKRLYLTDDKGTKALHIFALDFDTEYALLLQEHGYLHDKALDRPMAQIKLDAAFPSGLNQRSLPVGYRYVSLSEEMDFEKMNRALHRGFDHKGDPDPADLAGRRIMVSGPRFKPELTTVIEAPSGNWISYCGMWYDEMNHFGYIEPVATDPDYRRQGFGSAAVLESIRKCGLLGADTAYVWTDLAFYQSIGFEVMNTHLCWTKRY